jgi:hypothetical protein
VTIVRPGSIYGPRDRTSFARRARTIEQRRMIQVGPGDNHLTLIYAGDAARGVLLAGEAPHAKGRVYLLVNDELVTQRQFAAAVAAELGAPPPAWHMPYKLAVTPGPCWRGHRSPGKATASDHALRDAAARRREAGSSSAEPGASSGFSGGSMAATPPPAPGAGLRSRRRRPGAGGYPMQRRFLRGGAGVFAIRSSALYSSVRPGNRRRFAGAPLGRTTLPERCDGL